ncbi:MAG: YraN family protein [Spirochaetales bacterium]|nr:YraN family protein [Spirochaetales bacterium]
MASTYLRGVAGEDRAVQKLEGLGWQILARRFRSAGGEVDIIAMEADTIVFVEVKAWDVYGPEDLERSVGHAKRARLRRCAAAYLKSHPEYGDCRVRFDLMFLSWRMGRWDHWKDAF